MKSKWNLIASIFQLVVGVLAVASFVVLSVGGEDMLRWIPTLLLAIAFVVIGIIRIIDHRSQK